MRPLHLTTAWLLLAPLCAQQEQEAREQERLAARHAALLELPSLRNRAVRELQRLGASSVPALCRKLLDPRPDVVSRAALCLRALGPEVQDSVPQLRDLADSSYPATARAARWVLAAFEPQGITLVADYNNHRLIELDETGKVLLEIPKLTGIYHAERLPNGHYLVALTTGKRLVQEIDRNGKVVWTYRADRLNPLSVTRLPNDNTLIGNASGAVLEVDPKGVVVRQAKASYTWKADLLPDGNLLIAANGLAREVDWQGNTLRRFQQVGQIHDARRLPNGNTLLASNADSCVVEIDANDEIVLTIQTPKDPESMVRVANGDTIVGGRGFVNRYDHSGKLVWERVVGRAGSVRHY